MGYFKQLHIDCYAGECYAGTDNYETCYMQPNNPAFAPEQDIEPTEPPEPTDGDYDPMFDVDRATN